MPELAKPLSGVRCVVQMAKQTGPALSLFTLLPVGGELRRKTLHAEGRREGRQEGYYGREKGKKGKSPKPGSPRRDEASAFGLCYLLLAAITMAPG